MGSENQRWDNLRATGNEDGVDTTAYALGFCVACNQQVHRREPTYVVDGYGVLCAECEVEVFATARTGKGWWWCNDCRPARLVTSNGPLCRYCEKHAHTDFAHLALEHTTSIQTKLVAMCPICTTGYIAKDMRRATDCPYCRGNWDRAYAVMHWLEIILAQPDRAVIKALYPQLPAGYPWTYRAEKILAET
jgi:Zn-finger nucleic acid-binding protein